MPDTKKHDAVVTDLVEALQEAQAALNGAPNTIGLHRQIDQALSRARALRGS